MLCEKCTWPWGHCLLFDPEEAPTSRLAATMVKREPAPPMTIGEACLKRVRSPRPVSSEWDYRTQVVRREESPGWRELEESAKEKILGRWRTEIGVERKERRDESRWRWRIGMSA
ncbi:hypothetical protein TNCV_3870851 [Trichonephila clavipes]|nr:hypothetical protein TNCV_3870851 [Trichonephila clavipes]